MDRLRRGEGSESVDHPGLKRTDRFIFGFEKYECDRPDVRAFAVVPAVRGEPIRHDRSVFIFFRRGYRVGTRPDRLLIEFVEHCLFRTDAFPKVFRENAYGEILDKRRVRRAERKANRPVVQALCGYPLPVCAGRTFILGILDRANGKKHVVGRKRLSVMPPDILFEDNGICLAVRTRFHTLREVRFQCTCARIGKETGEDQPHEIALRIG